tara:strand:- start:27657 stop:28085 length:429 start_codon:yes stop_codon:yes gene_type:complete
MSKKHIPIPKLDGLPMPELVGVPKKLKKVAIYIVSYPILEIGNGSVHVHKEKFFYDTAEHLISQVGRFITDLEAKDEKGVLMISAISERKFLGMQEQIARITNAENRESHNTKKEEMKKAREGFNAKHAGKGVKAAEGAQDC